MKKNIIVFITVVSTIGLLSLFGSLQTQDGSVANSAHLNGRSPASATNASSSNPHVDKILEALLSTGDLADLKKIADGDTSGNTDVIRHYLRDLCEDISIQNPADDAQCDRPDYLNENSRQAMIALAQILLRTRQQASLRYAEKLNELHEKIISCEPSAAATLRARASSCQSEIICRGDTAIDIRRHIKESFLQNPHGAYGSRELADNERTVSGVDITGTRYSGLTYLRNYTPFDMSGDGTMTSPTEDAEEMQSYLQNLQLVELARRFQQGDLQIGNIRESTSYGSGSYLPAGLMSVRVFKCENVSVIENNVTTSENNVCYLGLSDGQRRVSDEQRLIVEAPCSSVR